MSYQIGQYRYEGNGTSGANPYLTDIAKDIESVEVLSQGDGGMFSDIGLHYVPANADASSKVGFSPNKSYYLNMSIPKDINYDIELTLKLVDEHDSSVFQNIEKIKIPKGGTGEDSYPVVLYRSFTSTEGNEIVKASVPIEVDNDTIKGVDAVFDTLYSVFDVNKNMRMYYVGAEDGTYVSLDKIQSGVDDKGNPTYMSPSPYNDMYMTASWRQVYDAESYPRAMFNLIFTPLRENLSKLILQMTRTSDDYNVQHIENGQTVFGRHIPLDKVKWTLQEVNNILPRIGHSPLSKISVQSHSNLLMCINGEQIKVGPSRLYELDAIPIKTFGVVANGYEDNFIVDYKYEDVSGN